MTLAIDISPAPGIPGISPIELAEEFHIQGCLCGK
ncbi:MAG: hypothetical protein ACI8VT_003195 [Saprospiraceae bacterium]